MIMSSVFQNSVSPYPGWERRLYRLSRPLSGADAQAFLGNEDLYTRDTPSGAVHIIHKYGLLEIHCIPGEIEIEVWYDPKKESYSSEYLDALMASRFN